MPINNRLLPSLQEGYKVSLNVYDLSQGLARQLSTTFLGKTIEGIWYGLHFLISCFDLMQSENADLLWVC